jgi:hypothetical protein
MSCDVFISYSTQDKLTADAVCAILEAQDIRCWIAPRDVPLGGDWTEALVEAIEACPVMVLVFSRHANDSRQIKREVNLAIEAGKTVIPVRVEDVTPSKSLKFSININHWLDAFPPPLDNHLRPLATSIRALLGRAASAGETAGKSETVAPVAPQVKPEPVASEPVATLHVVVPEPVAEIPPPAFTGPEAVVPGLEPLAPAGSAVPVPLPEMPPSVSVPATPRTEPRLPSAAMKTSSPPPSPRSASRPPAAPSPAGDTSALTLAHRVLSYIGWSFVWFLALHFVLFTLLIVFPDMIIKSHRPSNDVLCTPFIFSIILAMGFPFSREACAFLKEVWVLWGVTLYATIISLFLALAIDQYDAAAKAAFFIIFVVLALIAAGTGFALKAGRDGVARVVLTVVAVVAALTALGVFFAVLANSP